MAPRLILGCVVAASAVWSQTGSVSGVVRDDVSGTPIEGVRLALSLPRPPGVGLYSATSDVRGEFRFTGVQDGEFIILMSKAGYVPVKWVFNLGIVRISSGAEIKVERSLQQEAGVEGTVVSDVGEPITNADVRIDGLKAVTDAKGRFKVAGIAPGLHSLSMNIDTPFRQATLQGAPGARLGFPPEFTDASEVRLAPGEHKSGVTIRVAGVPLATLSGTVVDEKTGQAPDPGATIELAGPDRGFHREPVRTLDKDGSFRFELLRTGEYKVAVRRDRDFRTPAITSKVSLGVAGLAGHRVLLPASLGSLLLRLRQPLPAGGNLGLRSSEYASWAPPEQTAGTREIRFSGVQPGPWQVTYGWSSTGRTIEEVRGPVPALVLFQHGRELKSFPGIEIHAGENEPVEVELRERFVVTGEVVDGAGRPVPEAWIFYPLTPSGRVLVRGGMTDGALRFEIGPGEYDFSAWRREDMQRAGACPHAKHVKVTRNVTGMRLVLCE